jgi:hypothetical protein
MDENDNGVFFDQLFTISIPKDRPELTWLKYRMRHGRYTLLYRDANGLAKVARNLRVKFDLNTGKRGEEYNGHVMYARKASTAPAIHWALSSTSSLESIYQMSNVQMDVHQITLPEGWQSGKKIDLPFTPISLESIYATYNTALVLRPGTDFTLSGNTVTLNFSDIVGDGPDGELHFFYAANKLGDGLSGFSQEIFSKTSAYTSGETITLAGTPDNTDHMHIRMNRAITLRPGIDFTLSGTVVTLLFGSSPTVVSPDQFHVYHANTSSVAPLEIAGWKMFSFYTASKLLAGHRIILPHTPIANSLLVRQDDVMQLLPAIDYNLLTNEVEILNSIDADTRITCWYAY